MCLIHPPFDPHFISIHSIVLIELPLYSLNVVNVYPFHHLFLVQFRISLLAIIFLTTISKIKGICCVKIFFWDDHKILAV